MKKRKQCAHPGCDKPIPKGRPDQQYCSKSCAKKGNQYSKTTADMSSAVRAVMDEGMPYRVAGKKFNVPASTLHAEVKRIEGKKHE